MDSKLVDEVVGYLSDFDLDIWRDRQESPWVLGELDTAMMLEMSGDTKVVPVFLGRIADEKIPGDLRGKYSLDLRYNFQKRWLGERDTFTKTIITFAKGEDFVPREAYMRGLGLPLPKITSVSVDGARNSPGDWGASTQVTLDLEVIATVAPRAEIVVYFAPPTDSGFLHAILAAVEDDTHDPGVLCIGWGQSEPAWTRESITKINEALAAAAARGITVCCAAGDTGPADGVMDGKAHQARVGWDPCTGWGVPNGERLLTALKVLQTTRHSAHGKA